MTYTSLKYALLGFLLLYLILGFAGHLFREENAPDDLYPFFSWFLYVQVPNALQSGYDARALRPGHIPVSLVDAELIPETALHPSQIHERINALGRALSAKDSAAIAKTRLELESYFVQSAVYDVVKITYAPLERWKKGIVREETVLGQFDTSL